MVKNIKNSGGKSMKKAGIIIPVLTLVFLFTASRIWAGNLVIKGSTTVLPIAQKVTEVYTMRQLKAIYKGEVLILPSKDPPFIPLHLLPLLCLFS
jgi:ABC-type phosphate transport system substrate-binding protein